MSQSHIARLETNKIHSFSASKEDLLYGEVKCLKNNHPLVKIESIEQNVRPMMMMEIQNGKDN